MSYPKISIVMPSFNQVEFLESAIRSVLDQNYPNLEFIIIDGGSTDGSVDVIRRYEPRLAHWVSGPDGGHGDALNKGFKRSTGEILAWLNSDDLYHPWTLATVAEVFTSIPDADWITGIPVQWDRKGRISHTAMDYMRNKYDYCTGRYEWIQQESTFWRRSLWDKAGGRINERYKVSVDGELWSRFFLFSDIVHVQCVLGGFRNWGGNRSTTLSDKLHAEMRKAIADLESGLDSEARRNLQRLRKLRGIPQQRLGIRLRSLYQTLARERALNLEIAYRTAESGDGGWKLKAVPFTA